jgi:hypothetical protein
VKQVGTAGTCLCACLYTVLASGCGYVVLQFGGAVETPNTFTNEEYGNMHFVYSFFNGNDRATVALISTLHNFISQTI